MDEGFVLQTVGRLYLENVKLSQLAGQLQNKDIEIAALRVELSKLQGAFVPGPPGNTNDPNGTK